MRMPLGAQAHGRLHGALHGAAEGDAALELLGDVLGDQRGVDLGLADLDDVQGHLALGHLGEVAAQLLDVGALLADHHARTGGVDGDAGALGRTLDDDLGHARLAQPLAQHLADVEVLVQQLGVFAAFGVPARVPGPVDAEPQADRIDLLTHYLSSASARSRTTMVRWLNGLTMPARAAAAAGLEALHHQALADRRLGDDQAVDVELVVVLGVGDRRLQHLLARRWRCASWRRSAR